MSLAVRGPRNFVSAAWFAQIPGIAVRLQLGAHRLALCPRLALARLEGAQEVLDVVAVLVGDDVRLRRRAAGSPELGVQLIKEPEVDPDGLVDRAVEGPHLRRSEPAAGARLATEEDRLGRLVGVPRSGELVLPEGLDTIDVAEDPAVLTGVRVRAGLAGVCQEGARRTLGRLATRDLVQEVGQVVGRWGPAYPRRAACRRARRTRPRPPPPTATPRPPMRLPRISLTCDASSLAFGSRSSVSAPRASARLVTTGGIRSDPRRGTCSSRNSRARRAR